MGNKAACIDKNGKGILINFVSEKETDIVGFSPQLGKVIWDTADPNLFMGCSTDSAFTFMHNKNYYNGEQCSVVYELLSIDDAESPNKDMSFTSLDGVEPVFLTSGNVIYLTKSNAV